MKKQYDSVILFSSALLTAVFLLITFPDFKNKAYGKIIIEKNIKSENIAENIGFQLIVPETYDYDLIFPLCGTVTSSFNDITERKTAHKGIDIAAETGTEVKSATDGIVECAYYSQTYGWCISVKNENIKTLYAHNQELLYEQGDRVFQGDVIALSGNTGDSTGPHLHFEVIIDGVHIDPAEICK